MSTQADVTNYQANPELLADMSVDQLEALARGDESVNVGDTNSDAAPGAATEETTSKAETAKPPVTEQPKADGTVDPKDEDVAGILSKDGKHVIDFSVLQGTRAEKARLEQVVREQQEEIDRLKTPQQQGKPQERAPDPGEQPATALSDEELAAVEQEFPALGKVLRAQQKAIADLTGQVVEERQAQQQVEQRKTADSVQDAIDSVPKLAHLQAHDPDGFRLAQEIDTSLRGQKAWANKSLADRFGAVMKIYEVANGEITLSAPPIAQQGAPATQAAKPSQPAAAPVRRGPATLSDLPGGSPAPVDEMARIEQATSVELTTRFEEMSPDQLSDWIARNGG